jgi:hypothetical protein
MPTLIPTDHAARITWLGRVPDRDAALQAQPVTELAAPFDGPEGESHRGLTRPSCSRVANLYPRDTTIRNVRQFSILSAEELAEIAARMGVHGLQDRHRDCPRSQEEADQEIGAKLGIPAEHLLPYGHDKAKVGQVLHRPSACAGARMAS